MVAKRNEIVLQIQQLTKALKKHNIIIEKAILFGSYAKGSAGENSDIDVVLISNDFEGIRFTDREKIIPELIHFDCRFDVHPYQFTDFKEKNNWFIREILKNGWEIPLQ
jgi:uncharacterized protein